MFLVACEGPARIDDDRRKRHLIRFRHPLQHFIATQVGQTQVQHETVEGRLLQTLESFSGGGNIRNLHSFAREQLPDAVTLPLVVLDDEHPAHPLLELGFEFLEGHQQLLALHGLECVTDRSETERLLAEVRD